MISRLAIAWIAATLLTGAAHAQNVEIIKARQQAMKGMADATKGAVAMVRGTAPFNPAMAKATLQTYLDTASKIPAVFPADSKTGADTAALPAVWEKHTEFEAQAAKFKADIEANLDRASSLEEFSPALQAITRNCSDCHETFRAKKN